MFYDLVAEGGYTPDQVLDFTLGDAFSIITRLRHKSNELFKAEEERTRKMCYFAVAGVTNLKDQGIKKITDLYPLPWDPPNPKFIVGKKLTKEEAFLEMKAAESKYKEEDVRGDQTGNTDKARSG